MKVSLIDKINSSFRLAMSGNEAINILIYYWGGIAYAVSYFIFNPMIMRVDVAWVDISTSIIAIIYFIWHIYVLKKCAPKKPKLTKEEKKIMRIKARKEFARKFFRKLLLQESITKWDPIVVTTIIDLFCITHFLGYII